MSGRSAVNSFSWKKALGLGGFFSALSGGAVFVFNPSLGSLVAPLNLVSLFHFNLGGSEAL